MSDAYDPQATEEEASSKSQHMTFKDIRVLGVVILVTALILYPVYQMGRKKSEKAQCVNNLKAMGDAIALYANDHDDGLPVLFREENGVPAVNKRGLPYTWVSDISKYMNKRASFRCPSADEKEVVYVEDPTDSKLKIPCTYGMYAAYSGYKTFNIDLPERTVLLAETSNQGAMTSFDPLPFKDKDGKPIPDGFVIGWSDSNLQGGPASKSPTRLAFRDSANGDFSKAAGRHDEGIHALVASGARFIMQPKHVPIRIREGLPSDFWAVPARRR